jgi:hypothetical protein
MRTRDEPLDPQEVLEAAEAAHLADRRTVPIARDDTRHRTTVRLEQDEGRRDTVRLDQDTVSLPRRRPPGVRRRAPLPLAAGVAALWAAVVTFAPLAVVVALLPAAGGGSLPVGGTLRMAAAGWLLAHGVPLETAAGPVGLAPLALSAFIAWRVGRAGVHVTRARRGRGTGSLVQAVLPAVAVAVAYGGIGVLLALAAGGPGWGPQIPRAGLTLAVFGLVCAGYGSLRTTGAVAAVALRIPVVLRDGGRAGLVAAAGVLAAGAATAGTALALSGGPAAEVVAAYRTGVAGQAGLTLLCLAFAPNLAGWAVAYLVGPGFAVGTDTVVRSSEVALGPLPALPLVAALPTGPLPAVGAALLAAPVVAGGIAGWMLARWRTEPSAPMRSGADKTRPSAPMPSGADKTRTGWTHAVIGAGVAGVVAGVLLGFVAAASGGPLGGGQLATIGPEPVLVGVAAIATVVPGALLGAAMAAVLSRRRHP